MNLRSPEIFQRQYRWPDVQFQSTLISFLLNAGTYKRLVYFCPLVTAFQYTFTLSIGLSDFYLSTFSVRLSKYASSGKNTVDLPSPIQASNRSGYQVACQMIVVLTSCNHKLVPIFTEKSDKICWDRLSWSLELAYRA
jgi:hypothetical protein